MNALPSGDGRTEDTKRVARILNLVQMIAAHPRRYLRRDLAARFEISERMIQKDLEVIRHGLRLPLCRECLHQGGFLDHFFWRPDDGIQRGYRFWNIIFQPIAILRVEIQFER